MELTVVTATFSVLFSILFLFVGGLVGWIAKDYFWKQVEIQYHPEMYDENGVLLPDELIAVRFEPSEDFFDDYEDD
jgi:hypothetical protein